MTHYQHEWVRVRVGDRDVLMSRDALKDASGRRINPTFDEIAEIAHELGARLPTPEELDARWEQAEIKNPVHTQRLWLARGGKPADRLNDDGALHSRLIDEDVAKAGGAGIVGNAGKHWTKKRPNGICELYGAFVAAAEVSKQAGDFIGQGLPVHPSESEHTDAYVVQTSSNTSHNSSHRDYMTTGILSKDIDDEEPDTEPRPYRPDTDARDEPYPLALRRLIWLGYEWGQPGGVVEVPGDGDSPRILGYSKQCRRGGTFRGLHRDLTAWWDGGLSLSLPKDAMAWCAAILSGSLFACLRPGEVPPHGLRVSCREYVEDAKARGTWRDPDGYVPKPGDIQVLARYVWRNGVRVLADPTRGDNGHVRMFIRPTTAGKGWFFGGNESTPRAPQGELNHQERVIADPLLRGWITHVDDEVVSTRGLDVARYQAGMDYAAAAQENAWLIARATYGVRPDTTFAEHIERAREVGMQVGGYHFFRQHQSVDEQLSAFVEQLEAAEIGPGDIVPAVDLEYNDSGNDGPVVADLHNVEGRELVEHLVELYGACLVYLAPHHYEVLDRPEWILGHHVWVAHYGVTAPRWPWSDWTIWQHAVEPGYGAQLIDLNEARGELPTIPT